MAATNLEIELNYKKAIAHSQRFSSFAADLEIEANVLEDVLERLKFAWRGEEATSYQRKGGLLLEEIKLTAGILLSTAKAVEATAEKIRAVELKNQRLAEQRMF